MAEPVTNQELSNFTGHCVLIRSVYRFAERIWRLGSVDEQALLDRTCPTFARDIAQVTTEFVVLSAARINDPATDQKGNQNLTLEVFFKALSKGEGDPLEALFANLKAHGERLKTARNKLLAHHDRATVAADMPLATATWEQWDSFWRDLADFVNVINERMTGRPFSIEVGGVNGDAEILLKAFASLP